MATYSGFKWGGATAPSAGGVVTWSFATLAGQSYSFTSAILQQAYRDAITAAFNLWESVANIDFQYAATDAKSNDIRLGWDTIDGTSGTVGQAITYFAPRTGYDANAFSEIRFDTAENWAAGSDTSGINFFAVAVHEIGHTLGLEHSTDRTSIMYPTVGAETLSANDIANIQGLYGVPVVVIAPTQGDDNLTGTSAANTIDGLAGNDSIAGLAGNDVLRGGNDGDSVNGGAGADKIYGDAGNDTLIGGYGNDRLTGGTGDDIVSSDAGYDIFVFRAGDDNDRFTTFTNAYDKIDLQSYNFASFAAVKAMAYQAQTNVVIDLGSGDSITIANFTMANLTSGDFIL